MDRIFPRLEQLESMKDPLAENFIIFAKYLNNTLDQDWNIFIKPSIRGYAQLDVVITHPSNGCMVIKFLDWEDIEDYANTDIKNFSSDGGFKTNKSFQYKEKKIPNPSMDISDNINSMIENILPEISFTLQPIRRYKYKAFRRGLYFYNVSDTKRLNKRNDGKEVVLPWKFRNISLIGKDIVSQGIPFDEIITKYDVRWKMNLAEDEGFWDPEWHSYIRKKIILPYHKIEHGTYIKLTKEQERHVVPIENTHQRLKGVAGSGKTLVIAQRAARIASLECKVLVVSFNITLTHYIEHQVGRACIGFDPNLIEYKHFHKVCWDFSKQHGFDFKDKLAYKYNDELCSKSIEDKSKYYSTDVPNRVISEITHNKLQPPKYDAIIIDEGQDFHHVWYKMLELFLGKRNELLLVADDKQNVYNRDISWIYGMEDVQFRGPWRTLSITHRLPKSFIPVVKQFSDDYLKLDINEKFESGAQQAFPLMNPKIRWVEAKKITPFPKESKSDHCGDCYRTISKDEEQKKKLRLCSSCQGHQNRCFEIIHDIILELVNNGNQLDDIVLLVPTNIQGKELREFIKSKDLKVMDTFSRNSKLGFALLNESDDIDDSVKIATIYSFKGWEMPNVIILTELDNRFNDNTNFLMYTALTRTLNTLFVVNRLTEYISFGKYLNSIRK